MDLQEGESWIVKTTETTKLAPRVKQIVVGNLEMPKRRESPELVCRASATALGMCTRSARTLPNVHEPQQSTRSRSAIISREAGNQLTSIQTGPLVHLKIVNFIHEEFEVPKATVLVIEVTSASIVAELNDEVKTNSKEWED
jgi:hypothetical protein